MYALAQVCVVSMCVDVYTYIYLMRACVYAHECLVILYMCHIAVDYVLLHIHIYTVCLVVLTIYVYMSM